MRLTLVVSGTTCTRFRCLLEASLLTMTAGRSLRTSPPTAGSKLTHQTSPRFIGHVSCGGLGPFQRFRLARFVLGHLLVRNLEVLTDDIRPDEGLDKLANASPADDGVQPVVDALVNGDGELLLHGGLTTRVTTRIVEVAALAGKPLSDRHQRHNFGRTTQLS